MLEGPLREHPGVVEVVLNQIGSVGLRRRGACAEVDDRPHVFLERVEQPAVDLVFEPVGFQVVVEPKRREVAPLLAAIEPVDGDDAIVPALVEGPDDGASDQTGGAGHKDSPSLKHGQVWEMDATTWPAVVPVYRIQYSGSAWHRHSSQSGKNAQ